MALLLINRRSEIFEIFISFMNIDQINQEIENLASNGTGKSGEIKLGHGIYFTDYRKKPAGEGSIKCKIDFCVTK